MALKARILLVEDDPVVGQLFQELLPTHNLDVEWFEDAEAALEAFDNGSFDLVVSDKNLPGLSGLDLLQAIRSRTEDVDVLIMTAYADMKSMLAAIEGGVYDYIVKPFDSIDEVIQKIERALDKRKILLENRRLISYLTQANAEIEDMNQNLEHKVRERTHDLQEVNVRLEQLTLIDDVTGLYNQRFMNQRLGEEFRRARRHRQGLSILMLDLDNFKEVNDNHDHLFGTRVLQRVGQTLKESVRDIDMCIRYGGDEFTIILPHTKLDDATFVTERIRVALANTDVGDAGEGYWITASMGVAALGECTADSPRSLLRTADRALYEAKSAGRNQVVAIRGTASIAITG